MNWAIIFGVVTLLFIVYEIFSSRSRKRKREFEKFKKKRITELVYHYSKHAVTHVNLVLQLIEQFKELRNPDDIIACLGRDFTKDITNKDSIQGKLKYNNVLPMPERHSICVLMYDKKQFPGIEIQAVFKDTQLVKIQSEMWYIAEFPIPKLAEFMNFGLQLAISELDKSAKFSSRVDKATYNSPMNLLKGQYVPTVDFEIPYLCGEFGEFGVQSEYLYHPTAETSSIRVAFGNLKLCDETG